MNYNTMMTALKSSVCMVDFRKQDGSIREMLCSLHPSVTDALQQHANGDLITVFDIRANGIRSFNASTVINFAALIGGMGE